MTLEEIQSDQDNITGGTVEHVTTGDETKSFICVSFKIDKAAWTNIRNGTKDGMKAFLDWVNVQE